MGGGQREQAELTRCLLSHHPPFFYLGVPSLLAPTRGRRCRLETWAP